MNIDQVELKITESEFERRSGRVETEPEPRHQAVEFGILRDKRYLLCGPLLTSVLQSLGLTGAKYKNGRPVSPKNGYAGIVHRILGIAARLKVERSSCVRSDKTLWVANGASERLPS